MRTGRLHYEIEPPAKAPRAQGLLLVYVLFVATAGLGWLAYEVTRDRADAQPVRLPVVQAFPLEPLTAQTLAEARVEVLPRRPPGSPRRQLHACAPLAAAPMKPLAFFRAPCGMWIHACAYRKVPRICATASLRAALPQVRA